MIEIDLTLTFQTPLNIGSGAQVGTLADRAIIKARDGWPYIPATAIKGQLRHAVERAARGLGRRVCNTHYQMCLEGDICPACALFGSPWLPGRLRFVDLELCEPLELAGRRFTEPHPRTQWRYGVALSRRRHVAQDELLYTTELFMPGQSLSFGGTLEGTLDERGAAWFMAGLGLLPALGRARSGGLGHLKLAKADIRLNGELLDAARLRAALEQEAAA